MRTRYLHATFVPPYKRLRILKGRGPKWPSGLEDVFSDMLARGKAAEEPNNASADGLGENWKSALCVTSLYDSYVAVQHENEALRDQVRALQHANEVLVAENRSGRRSRALVKPFSGPESDGSGALDKTDDEDGVAVYLKEIQLLRTEKSQLELVFDKRKTQLEAELSEYKALYNAQLEKYQHKFNLDPNEPRRAALATQALQDTLEKTVYEKEELAIQHHKLQQRFLEVEMELRRTKEALEMSVTQLQAKTVSLAQQRIKSVLEKWVLTNMSKVWKQWRLGVMMDRLQAKEAAVEKERVEQAKRTRKQMQDDRVTKWLVQALQTTTRRVFATWKQMVVLKKRRQAEMKTFSYQQDLRRLHSGFAIWKQTHRVYKTHAEAGQRLASLLNGHKQARAWRKWVVHLWSARLASEKHEKDQLHSNLLRSSTMMKEMEELLAKATQEAQLLREQLDRTTEFHELAQESKQRDQDLWQQKLGAFFLARSSKHLLYQTFAAWHETTLMKIAFRRKTRILEAKRNEQRARQTIQRWHASSKQQRKCTEIALHVVQRMRMLGVFRCFLAWRSFANTRKDERTMMRRVIHHMSHRQVICRFKEWTCYTTRRKRCRHRLQCVLASTKRAKLANAFVQWRSTSKQLGVALEALNRQTLEQEWRQRVEQSKKELKVLRQAFLSWRSTVKNGRKYRQLTSKYALRWRSGAMGKCFETWKIFLQERRVQRECVRRLLSRCGVATLREAWKRWHTHALVSKQAEVLLKMAQERDRQIQSLQWELEQLRIVEAAARDAVQEQEEQHTLAIRDVQLELAAAHDLRRQYKHGLISLYFSIERQRFLKRCLREWKQATQDRKALRLRVEAFITSKEISCLHQVFDAWKLKRRKNVLLLAAMSMLKRTSQHQMFELCWISWRELARRHHAARQLESRHGKHECRRLLLAVWRVWYREARQNHLLKRILTLTWLRCVHKHMNHVMGRWKEAMKEHRAKDEALRKSALMESLRLKVCLKWSNCSVRAVLLAWKHAVQTLKKRREGERRFQRCAVKMLMMTPFNTWRIFVRERRVQRMWLTKWQDMVHHQFIRRSIDLWKTATVNARRQELETLRQARQLTEELVHDKDVELLELRNTALQFGQRVQLIEAQQSLAEENANKSKRLLSLVRWFYAWRSRTQKTHHVNYSQRLLALHRTRRRVRTAFDEWKQWVHQRRVHCDEVDRRRRHHEQLFLRSILREWRRRTLETRDQERRIRKLRTKQRARLRRDGFSAWYRFIRLSIALSHLVRISQDKASVFATHSGFERWKQCTRWMRAVQSQEHERQKRIMSYLMNRESYCVTRYFQSWKQVGMDKRKRVERATAILKRKQHVLMRVVWMSWSGFIVNQRQQLLGTKRLGRIYVRWHLRVAISQWRSNVHRHYLALLLSRSEAITKELEWTRTTLEKKEEMTKELQSTLEQTQLRLATQEEALQLTAGITKSEAQSRELAAQRMRVLARVFLRQRVLRSTVTAFSRWKWKTCCQVPRVRAALSIVLHICSYKQRRAAFLRWKRVSNAHSRLERFHSRRKLATARIAWNEWKLWSHNRIAIKRKLLLRWLQLSHVKHVELELQKRVHVVFRFWKVKVLCVRLDTERSIAQHALVADNQLQQTRWRRSLLAKWCWQAYHQHCEALRQFFRNGITLSRRQSNTEVRSQVQNLLTQVRELEAEVKAAQFAKTDADANALKTPQLDKDALDQYSQGLQTLFREFSSVTSTSELFAAISSGFSRVLPASSGILWLLDPLSNELWTTNLSGLGTDPTVIQAPAVLGITGAVLASNGPVLIDNAFHDKRFHPLVDQYALKMTGSPVVDAFGRHASSLSTSNSLFCLSIVAADGSVYGVLQVAFQKPNEPSEASKLDSQIQLLGRALCFFVEQMLFEMLRHCRDRLRARSRQNFVKLFKQNKNWRKYFVQVERQTQKTEAQLQQILVEQDFLLQEKERLQDAMRLVEEREEQASQEVRDRTTQEYQDLIRLLGISKKKLTKLKQMVDAKEAVIIEKTKEVDKVSEEFAQYRQEVRARDWQTILSHGAPQSKQIHHDKRPTEAASKESSLLHGAEFATINNQLVRAESDNLLLVKAVDVATKHNGAIPEQLKMEVSRIATRLKKNRD